MLEGERKELDEKVNVVAKKTGFDTTTVYVILAFVAFVVLMKLFG